MAEDKSNDPASVSQDDIDAALAAGAGEAASAQPPAAVVSAVDAVERIAGEHENATVAQVSESQAAGNVYSEGRPDEKPVGQNAGAHSASANAGADVSSLLPSGALRLDLPDFGGGAMSDEEARGISLLGDVHLDVKIELGRADMYIDDVLKLGEGSVVELDKLAGDPVDVLVNDRLVARGEVLVLNDNFCVRISEILPGATEVVATAG
ncbi:MAG TPA: flagellar motor switch protein FliN [Phycisphaerae bacterium]|nr:flagellar motor switch protein FliN [Phycisphaerae bacterium]